LLGFDDAYPRGRRDLGADGFAIVELIPDWGDVMASPGFGAVGRRHFEQLDANLMADRAMRAGLAAMYERRDAPEAVLRFREVLTSGPTTTVRRSSWPRHSTPRVTARLLPSSGSGCSKWRPP
jgi:hypothetical protein